MVISTAWYFSYFFEKIIKTGVIRLIRVILEMDTFFKPQNIERNHTLIMPSKANEESMVKICVFNT